MADQTINIDINFKGNGSADFSIGHVGRLTTAQVATLGLLLDKLVIIAAAYDAAVNGKDK